MRKQIIALAAGTFLLAACSDEPVGTADAAAGSATASDTGSTSTSGEPSADTAADTRGDPIPNAFHGAWGIMGDCGDPQSVVRISEYNMVWPGQGDGAVINVRPISATQVEMEEAPKPDFPDADLRFGLSISPDGQGMTWSSPQSSSLPFARCADAESAAASLASGGNTTAGLPVAFHGSWDDANGSNHGNACDAVNGDMSTITADARRYSYGTTRFTNVRRIDDRTYEMTAQHIRNDGETLPGSITRYSLDETGRFITETIEGYDPFIYVKCE